jgi:hypothetical protein
VPSGTSCTRATRCSSPADGAAPSLAGPAAAPAGPGAQKVVSLIQTDSRITFSAKPKAWNISIERTLMPSA